jgi:hypothetical protein
MAICPLCKSPDADVGQARGAGAVANLKAVLCPAAPFIPSPSHCKGFLIESRLLRSDSITPNIAAKLAEIARQRYKDDGSDMLTVTKELVRRLQVRA